MEETEVFKYGCNRRVRVSMIIKYQYHTPQTNQRNHKTLTVTRRQEDN